MTGERIYVALGSNVGDREANLRQAVALLPHVGVSVRSASSFYETEPLDYLDQPWFLNCVLEAETELTPPQLLGALQSIEKEMHSQKAFAKGPRKIDLDILLYGDATLDTPGLKIPHPRMAERRFVLVPLAEIAPSLAHPSWRATASQLLDRTADRGIVRKLIRKGERP